MEEVIAGWQERKETLAATPRPSAQELEEQGLDMLRGMGVLVEYGL